MIKYNLECSCGEKFESWFQSSNEYDKLVKKNLISCYACGSTRDVKKSLMSPSVFLSRSSTTKDDSQKKEFYKNIKKKLEDLRDFVEKNAEYVGDKFVSEVRSIHYDNKKKRSIYGTASLKETKELMDEGIEVSIIPWISKESN